MEKKVWQDYAVILKELLSLEYIPVALSRKYGEAPASDEKKLRICRAILDAGKGNCLEISKANNACFGASWHLGFNKIKDAKIIAMIKKFVVEGEKLFCSYEALDRLLSEMEEVGDNSRVSFLLSPMEAASLEPEIVIFIVDAQSSCRLLTLLTFIDGVMPKIKIGGPTCRMSIIYPLMAQEANISFYDYTARKICNVEKDKLLITIPYKKIPQIVESIDKCSGGRAKIEFPKEFRQFLQSALGKSGNI